MRRFAEKPPKPYPDFALFAGSNGCWMKKIGGQKRSFGAWRWPDKQEYERSWREALTAYHKYLEAEAHGRVTAADPRTITLGALHDGFLTRKHAEAENGEIKPRTFADMRAALRDYRDRLGAGTTVGELEADPRRLEKYLDGLNERLSFHPYNRANQYIRSMWNWAAKPSADMLDRPFKLIELHKQQPMKVFRRQRRMERAAGISTTFDVDEVAALIEHSRVGWRLSPHVHAFVLLGYFAAYGNTDHRLCSKEAVLPLSHGDECACVALVGELVDADARVNDEVDRAQLVDRAIDQLAVGLGEVGQAANAGLPLDPQSAENAVAEVHDATAFGDCIAAERVRAVSTGPRASIRSRVGVSTARSTPQPARSR